MIAVRAGTVGDFETQPQKFFVVEQRQFVPSRPARRTASKNQQHFISSGWHITCVTAIVVPISAHIIKLRVLVLSPLERHDQKRSTIPATRSHRKHR
jgi:hypothetical protein